MARTAILAIRIISDASRASRGFDEAQTRMQRFEAGARRAAAGAAVAVGAVAVVAKQAFDSASRLQQAGGAVESVFGAQARAVDTFARQAATSVGLATAEYSELASVLGSQLKNLGVATDELVPKTNSLITMGADLAATFGGTTAEAVEALSSLFRGEADPIERYGVSIKQSDVNARLAAQGLTGLTGNALKQAETQARLALLTEQTASAQGQFAREGGSAAGAQQRFNAQLENAKASLGEVLLPVVSQFADKLASVADWASRNAGTVQVLAGVVVGLAVAVLAINAAMSIYSAVSAVVTAAQWAMNSAFLANPITWVVIAVIALVAAFILAYKKCEAFRNFVDGAVDAIVAAWNWVVDAVKAVIRWIVDAGRKIGEFGSKAWDAINRIGEPIRWVIDLVRKLIDWIANIRWPSPPSWMNPGNWFGEAAYPPPGGPPAGGLAQFAGPGGTAAYFVGRAAGASGSAPMVVQQRFDITFSGVVGDPIAVADQIRKVINDAAVSRGTTPAAFVGGTG
ncbi:tail length tape measure protein [Gordonia phage EricDab]|uniref:Tape measure protein n=1 Tax=Gordonia phage EricDab TaxID=3070616 RepID=A0A4D6E3K7_9CAUD|nr:tail length tape measure protein [Gordonia phage EricDab]QBZ73186.1 tape measure protein [Gordonia phage EricDab]